MLLYYNINFIKIEFHLNSWMFTSIVPESYEKLTFQGLDDVGAVVMVVVVASFLEVIARPHSFQQIPTSQKILAEKDLAHVLAIVFSHSKEHNLENHHVMQSDLLNWVQLHLDSDSISHRIHVCYIYGNIYHQYTPNVSIYTRHGSYGYWEILRIFPLETSGLSWPMASAWCSTWWFLPPHSTHSKTQL